MSVSLEAIVYFVVDKSKVVMVSLDQSACRRYVKTYWSHVKNSVIGASKPKILSRKVNLSPESTEKEFWILDDNREVVRRFEKKHTAANVWLASGMKGSIVKVTPAAIPPVPAKK